MIKIMKVGAALATTVLAASLMVGCTDHDHDCDSMAPAGTTAMEPAAYTATKPGGGSGARKSSPIRRGTGGLITGKHKSKSKHGSKSKHKSSHYDDHDCDDD
jgi:hypothetical protein